MRHTPRYLMTDPDEVKRLIRGNPWATCVSPASGGLVASRHPALLMEDDDDIVIASHFGRPDEQRSREGDAAGRRGGVVIGECGRVGSPVG